jgi:hypothetical protein
MNYCQYKYALGIPNKGIHTHILGFALYDFILTIIVSLLIMKLMKSYFPNISHSLLTSIILIILVFIGDYLHNKVCLVNTP